MWVFLHGDLFLFFYLHDFFLGDPVIMAIKCNGIYLDDRAGCARREVKVQANFFFHSTLLNGITVIQSFLISGC